MAASALDQVESRRASGGNTSITRRANPRVSQAQSPRTHTNNRPSHWPRSPCLEPTRRLQPRLGARPCSGPGWRDHSPGVEVPLRCSP